MNLPLHRLSAAAATVLLAVAATACSERSEAPAEAAAGEWRQFRGPNAQGVSEASGLPRRWSGDSANLRWQTTIGGLGNSSPVVSDGKVFLTTSWGEDGTEGFGPEEELHRVVLALDLESGEPLWQRTVFTTPQEKRHPRNTPAAATPAVDGERIYAYFGMGLAALDYDGNLLWETEVDPFYLERARYGVVSSPIVVGDRVIITRDDEWGGDEIEDVSWLAAYDRRTGEELWRHQNDETCCSYATPVVRDTESGAEILFASTPFVAGYAPADGERLWTAEHTARQVVPTPLLAGDVLVLPGSVHQGSLFAWRLNGEGAATEAEPLWGGARSSPKIPSPVIVGGRLFIVTDRGVLAVYDLQSGEQLAQRRLPRGNYSASVVAGDGKLYAVNDSCVTAVVSTSGKFKTLAENQLEGRCEASPALTDGAILIRSLDRLYCVERGAEPSGERDRDGRRQQRRERKRQSG